VCISIAHYETTRVQICAQNGEFFLHLTINVVHEVPFLRPHALMRTQLAVIDHNVNVGRQALPGKRWPSYTKKTTKQVKERTVNVRKDSKTWRSALVNEVVHRFPAQQPQQILIPE